MSTARPTVSVYSQDDGSTRKGSELMPSVFLTPLRPDLVRAVHTGIAKNRRQAYGVASNAGYQTSAESWGTGRAVSRIPRVPGGGTHRAGQAAFGNMCRGGGMFNPNKTWRRWHRKVNVTQKRHALATAIAASALPSLVMARGHRISDVPEMPLVVGDGLESVSKTRDAVKILQRIGCGEDLQRVKDSKKVRCGRGKTRNRRYTMRRGPLVVYSKDDGIARAFRNIPGVELCHVDRLNLLKVAPGGSMGRMIVWTRSAFRRLQSLYGRHNGFGTAPLKHGYHLPRPIMANADLDRIINSDEVQSVLKPKMRGQDRRTQHKNPLKNRSVLCRLNPAAAHKKELTTLSEIKGTKQHERLMTKKIKRKTLAKASKKASRTAFRAAMAEYALKRKVAAAEADEE